jgi:hypothetical protein
LFSSLTLFSTTGIGRFKSVESIERIVVMGFPSSPASVSSNGQSIGFVFKDGTLTLKSPARHATEDFTIEIKM